MTDSPADQLARYCREQTGDRLRCVARYNQRDYEMVHLRADLRSQYDAPQFDRLVSYGQQVHERVWSAGDETQPLGRAQATTHYFEDAFVVQLLAGERDGYLLTFDSPVGSELGTFLDDCLQQVPETSAIEA